MHKNFEHAADLRIVDKQGPNRSESICGLVAIANESQPKQARFINNINYVYVCDVRTFVEVGHLDRLTMFVERILSGKSFHALSTGKQKGDANCHFVSAIIAEWIRLGRVEDPSVPLGYVPGTDQTADNRGVACIDQQPDNASAIVSEALDRLGSLDPQSSGINRMVHA